MGFDLWKWLQGDATLTLGDEKTQAAANGSAAAVATTTKRNAAYDASAESAKIMARYGLDGGLGQDGAFPTAPDFTDSVVQQQAGASLLTARAGRGRASMFSGTGGTMATAWSGTTPGLGLANNGTKGNGY